MQKFNVVNLQSYNITKSFTGKSTPLPSSKTTRKCSKGRRGTENQGRDLQCINKNCFMVKHGSWMETCCKNSLTSIGFGLYRYYQ